MAEPYKIQFQRVSIIGAGPAGLALCAELVRRGVTSLVLERGETVGDSWRRMPRHLKLLSPWKANWLPGARTDEFPTNTEMSRARYWGWLDEYARQMRLPVRTGVEVTEVSREPDGTFRVRTKCGDFATRLLVNATGCFSNPLTPEISGARDTSIPQRHTADYQDAETLRTMIAKKNPLVLIVGQRLSAGQALVELVDAGFTVALSCRRPIQFGSGPLGWWLFFRIHPWIEARRLKRHGATARGFAPRMPGGRARRLIEGGAVRVFPEIARFEKHDVIFTDGQRLQPDAVLNATGFRPALRHLASLELELDDAGGRPQTSDMESVARPGLFFIGLDHVRNFQSRFLRGIRNDAGFLAERIEQRLQTENHCAGQIEAKAAVAHSL